jgi:UPF0271 protein
MISINCDMGESYGIYTLGDDAGIMPHITHANVACGFHGSDPDHIQKTVLLAKQHDVRIGAHFSLPDRQGFGRREMKLSREELRNAIIYQIGALQGFVHKEGLRLSHLKPHGALYGMAAKYEHVARAVADAAKVYKLPVFGMAGTLQERIYRGEGVEFVPEFFADLDYGDDGQLIITREHKAPPLQTVADKVKRALTVGEVVTVGGKTLPVRAQTLCVHSDTPNAVALVQTVANCVNSVVAIEV